MIVEHAESGVKVKCRTCPTTATVSATSNEGVNYALFALGWAYSWDPRGAFVFDCPTCKNKPLYGFRAD